jgi:hypothetical protein
MRRYPEDHVGAQSREYAGWRIGGQTIVNQLSVEKQDPESPAEWRDHIRRYGNVIVHNALPEQNLEATIDDIWRHTGADPKQRSTSCGIRRPSSP